MKDEHDVPADRNKTDLTHKVTEGAARWLAAIGAKAIETEVPVGPKWVADLAAFWSPTPTEATLEKLIPRAQRYPYGEGDAAAARWREAHDARLAAFRALPRIITLLVEVKTSRADFGLDARVGGKFTRGRPADLHVLAVPMEMLPCEKLPTGWWVLHCSAHDGEVLRVTRSGGVVATDADAKLNLVAAIAERRHNRTANAFFSALSKRRRAEDAAALKARHEAAA
jgi:hypothetical protein